MASPFVPDRGDLVWIDFNPLAVPGKANRQAALVISPKAYNDKTGLALICPITSQAKGYPFEVLVQEKKVTGAVLSDQVSNLNWKAGRANKIARIDDAALAEVLGKIAALIQV